MRKVPAMRTTTPTTGTVLPLTTATDHRIAGRKAATLARLAAAGFPVPPGVVLPPALFESASRERDLPAEVATALLDAVWAWGEVPLAVRSSAVEEDSAEASYAGLFTTVLNVRGAAALLDAVRECWGSAFNARVTSYAGSEPPRLAVLVQPRLRRKLRVWRSPPTR
jgi:phosphoenolpyruvate synthase/pyruvate phosphate dikinase